MAILFLVQIDIALFSLHIFGLSDNDSPWWAQNCNPDGRCHGTYMPRVICPRPCAQGRMPWCICRGAYVLGHVPQAMCPGPYALRHLPWGIYPGAHFPGQRFLKPTRPFACRVTSAAIVDVEQQQEKNISIYSNKVSIVYIFLLYTQLYSQFAYISHANVLAQNSFGSKRR